MTNQKKKRGPPPKTSRSTPPRTGPAFFTPMAAKVVERLPEGDDWVYELKFDGYWALITKDGQRVELRARKNKDLAGMSYPELVAQIRFVEWTAEGGLRHAAFTGAALRQERARGAAEISAPYSAQPLDVSAI